MSKAPTNPQEEQHGLYCHPFKDPRAKRGPKREQELKRIKGSAESLKLMPCRLTRRRQPQKSDIHERRRLPFSPHFFFLMILYFSLSIRRRHHSDSPQSHFLNWSREGTILLLHYTKQQQRGGSGAERYSVTCIASTFFATVCIRASKAKQTNQYRVSSVLLERLETTCANFSHIFLHIRDKANSHRFEELKRPNPITTVFRWKISCLSIISIISFLLEYVASSARVCT